MGDEAVRQDSDEHLGQAKGKSMRAVKATLPAMTGGSLWCTAEAVTIASSEVIDRVGGG